MDRSSRLPYSGAPGATVFKQHGAVGLGRPRAEYPRTERVLMRENLSMPRTATLPSSNTRTFPSR